MIITMKRLFLAAVAAGCVSHASAYDMAVVFRVDETGAKTIKFAPTIIDASDHSTIASPILNEADSTFLFKELPANSEIMVIYDLQGDIYGERVKGQPDTTTIYIPAFYAKDATMLKNITVTADNRFMSTEKETYIPTGQNKKISADGTSLLQNIGITTLNVSALEGTISTIGGEAVSTFIDFRPASRTDVRNIRAEDVKRVEVYDFPSDPRFGGAKHVVNFVMEKYEFGGYTKLDGSQYTIGNQGDYSAFTKFAYKKMQYDAGVDFNYVHNIHDGIESHSKFEFPEKSVETERTTESSLTKKRNTMAFLRATYESKKHVISNTVKIEYDKRPDCLSTISEKFNTPPYQSGLSTSKENTSGTSFVWSGDYSFFFPDNLSLSVTPLLSYARNKGDNRYIIENSTDIINLVEEKAWYGTLNASLRKSFGPHSFSTGVFGEAASNDIDYGGTIPSRQTGREYSGGIRLQANLEFGKFSFYPSFTYYVTRQIINGVGETLHSPKYYINGSYLFNSKNRLQFSSEFYQMVTSQSFKTPYMQISDQINAISGNPDLKPAKMLTSHVVYNFMPLRQFSASAFCRYDYSAKTLSYDYMPEVYQGRDIMVRRFVNGGNSNAWTYGAYLNSQLFENSLSLNASAQGTSKSIHGPFSASGTYFNFNLNARYTIKGFYAAVYYQSPQKSIYTFGRTRRPEFYYLQIGWGNGNLNLSATAINIFSRSYKSFRTEVETRYFQSTSTELSPSLHSRFIFSATYSFSYGKKKVSTNIDTDIPTGAQSQILK